MCQLRRKREEMKEQLYVSFLSVGIRIRENIKRQKNFYDIVSDKCLLMNHFCLCVGCIGGFRLNVIKISNQEAAESFKKNENI